MSGLYIHIPFCAKRCIYCGFFSTTQHSQIDRYVDDLCKEIQMRVDYLKDQSIKTIYFGGGTPSLLKNSHLNKIFETIKTSFYLTNLVEVTFECNPDDLSDEYVQMLSSTPINRISMGIQTFNDSLLSFLGRRHNSTQAINAVKTCRKHGFNNISIDLMYGLPEQTLKMQTDDITQAIQLNVPHISAYHLSYEDGTPIKRMKDESKVKTVDEELSVQMFDNVCNQLEKNGYNHYEISNFCKNQYYSRHNSGYWDSSEYLGIGAGAHSYNGISRQWNPDNLNIYLEGIENGRDVSQKEILTDVDKYNECVMLSLRTSKGIDLKHFTDLFGNKSTERLLHDSEKYIQSGVLFKEQGCIRFKEHSLFVSDDIISSLFID